MDFSLTAIVRKIELVSEGTGRALVLAMSESGRQYEFSIKMAIGKLRVGQTLHLVLSSDQPHPRDAPIAIYPGEVSSVETGVKIEMDDNDAVDRWVFEERGNLLIRFKTIDYSYEMQVKDVDDINKWQVGTKFWLVVWPLADGSFRMVR